jgi:hypothetical protein
MELALSIAAFVVSAVTLGSTYRIWQLSDRRSRIPVLVFILVDGKGWVLRNVGNGPALNIVVARKAQHDDQEWLDPTSVPPLARDAEVPLGWIRKGVDAAALGATYQDFAGADTARPGRTYTAICAHSLSSVLPGRRLPAWTAAQLEPSWQRERRLRMTSQPARPPIEAAREPAGES